MKIEVQNKKGLTTVLSIIIDKKTIQEKLEKKLSELQSEVSLKGFRPGKVPPTVIKSQFGKAVYGEVIDNILRESSNKALVEKKIKAAGQPKIDLKTYGEDKDLEYVISVTELPKIDIKSIENIKFNEYNVKIDSKETDKRIKEIAKTQKNFKEVESSTKASEGDLVIFDYKASIDGKDFKGNEGKNTQIEIGKDLFIKGFDKQLIGVKKSDDKNVEVKLPENFPEKELVNKNAIFNCKIISVKKSEETKINDDFAKNLGAKDLNNLKELISKQINDEYKNSLNTLSNKDILEQIDKIKIDAIPENLIEQEIQILSQNMKEDEAKKNNKEFEQQAKKRIKAGLILNEFGEQNKIKVTEQEIQNEIQKQLRMMPGQEKMLQEYYQKNPSLLANLRGSLYEEKILKEIKLKAKSNKKDLSKEQAEKLLKEENEKHMKEHHHDHSSDHSEDKHKQSAAIKKQTSTKKAKITAKKTSKSKKVSKK